MYDVTDPNREGQGREEGKEMLEQIYSPGITVVPNSSHRNIRSAQVPSIMLSQAQGPRLEGSCLSLLGLSSHRWVVLLATMMRHL